MSEIGLLSGNSLISVGLDREGNLVSVHLYFSASKWRDRLISFDKGDAILVEGQIDDISTRALFLWKTVNY